MPHSSSTFKIAGILNVTSDSFSDGNRYLDTQFAIEKGLSLDEIARRLSRRKMSRKMIAGILSKVDLNEYKRRQAPPILRVSEKAWFGRRMPITNHFRG